MIITLIWIRGPAPGSGQVPESLPGLPLPVVEAIVGVGRVRRLSRLLGASEEANDLLPWNNMAGDRLSVHICLQRGLRGLVDLSSNDLHAD